MATERGLSTLKPKSGSLTPREPREPERAFGVGGKVPHFTREERVGQGKAARRDVPLDAHAVYEPTDLRADPIALLEQQAVTRVADLIPIRYGRMSSTPFAFYRGAALVMASDLSGTPTTPLRVQLCGDAHLSNFGIFSSPERRLVFDLNDFDESSTGPFEWDVKRLAASIEVAARANGFKPKARRQIVLDAVASYRTTMREFAGQGHLAVWYASADVEQVLQAARGTLRSDRYKMAEGVLAKARTRDSMRAFAKLTTEVDGEPRIVSDPPLIVPVEDLYPDLEMSQLYAEVRDLLRSYRRTLQSDRRHLLEQFRLVQMARKVVGVGSVGTRAWILLLMGRDSGDPLFLQVKEAQTSVLEPFAGTSVYRNHGQRVVAGQHLMQASSDIFLGWQRVTGLDSVDRDYYVRQLYDGKASIDPAIMLPEGMTAYARACGWTLARAHARSGDRISIAAYLGAKDGFDQAVADFSVAYADQNERDHAELLRAIESGRVVATTGV